MNNIFTGKRTFQVGDKIDYPGIGAGKITAWTHYREFGRTMYVAQMDKLNMKILIPIDKIHKIGVLFLGK